MTNLFLGDWFALAPPVLLGQATKAAAAGGGSSLGYALSQPYVWAIVLLTIGLYLMLPPGSNRIRMAGAAFCVAALGCLVGTLHAKLRPEGSLGTSAVFWTIAAVTVASSVSTVTSRSPVYCALWFGMTLLGTSAMFLFSGAQFLAVATVVVYAGAILVTFLFVLMLATPTGNTVPDRITSEPLMSAATGAVLVGILTMMISGGLPAPPPRVDALRTNILANEHMAGLGENLFGKHLLAVELAGALLMIAIVAAVAIVSAGKGGELPTAGGSGPSKAIPNMPSREGAHA